MTSRAREIFHGKTGIFPAIALCLERECILSALVLAYSAIDNLSWLSLPEGQQKVTRQKFISWAERYVLPGSSVECSGADLYGARCGLLHTLTPESRMAKEGKAVMIGYSWGPQAPYRREVLEKYGAKWIMVHVDTLCRAVGQGALRFWEDVEKDSDALERVNKRAEMLLRPAPGLPRTLP